MLNKFPLTGPQKNIYQLEQVNLENTNLNSIYTVLKLPKNTNLEILDKVLNKIIETNDALRLRFTKNEDDELVQYVEEYTYKPSRIIYHSSESIVDVIEQEKQDTLSITGKINELAIISTPFNAFVFYKTHHILSDGWGMTQVADQIKELYYMIENGEDISNYIKPSYIDFINREQEYLNSPRYEKDLIFWNETVKNIEPCTIFKRKNNFDKSALRFEKEIPQNICEKIENYCTENKITEYSFFLGIISIYFNQLYNMNNFAIGTPFLNRQKRFGEFEETGLHVSTLPLHIYIDNNFNFVDLCKDINTKNLGLYKHGSCPYYNIQKLYNTEKNNNNNIFEIGFSYQINVSEKEFKSNNYNPEEDLDTGIGECTWLFSGEQNNSIIFHLTQLNVRKLFAIDYLTTVFDNIDIEKMFEIIFYIIEQILNYPTNMQLSEIQLITPNELNLLAKVNNTGNYEKNEKNIVNYLEDVCKLHSKNIALICDNEELTYEDFNKKINCVANYLLSKNIQKNTPIVLLFDKSFDMLISMFAIIKIGCYYVPILPDESENRINFIINDCKPSCILTHKNYENLIKKYNIDYYNFNSIMKDNNNTTFTQNISYSPSDLAYMIYTSGSTGNPKGVQIMHKNIISFIESQKQNTYLKPDTTDVSMSLLKYSFDASGIDIYSSLLIGGSLLLVSKNDELNPIKVLELIEKHKVTRSFLIPKWIEHIASTSLNYNFDLSSLKILGTGGEVLKPIILQEFLNKYNNLKLINLYGPTETTMFTTYKIISNNEIENNYTSIGKPIPCSRIGIINNNNLFLPTNYEGELIIYEDDSSINNIAKGYLNLEEQNKKKFINIFNPLTNSYVKAYKTGDIAKINNNLEIDFIGRTDDIIKANGGYLLSLNEVENQINNILGENIESYCVAVPFNNTKAIVLFVHNNEKSVSIAKIKKYLKENLSFYMQPKKIIELSEIPRSNAGKVDRQQLKNLAIKDLEQQSNTIIKPITNIEIEIYNIIKNLINIDEFSITDDFLDDLGIDSLSLTSIFTALNNYNLTMQDLYTYSNIKDLAQFIENNNCSLNIEPELDNIENVKIPNVSSKFDLSTILITGVTGFLGIHLLHNLLFNKKVKKIYCLIRNKIDLDGYARLKNMIDFYYSSDKKILNLIDKKVVVLNGDISKPNFNLTKDTYILLKKTVKTVINSAANVKHYAKPEKIKKDNILSVDNMIDFCENNISLAHISTLSIAGFKCEDTLIDKTFDENTLYIKQAFNNNPYLISKFNAEKHILEAIENNGLKAKIFRLGNIMPRRSDGVFQQNADQNIFITALNTFLNLQVMPKELLNLGLEFSPVDDCATAILSLMKDKSNCIYHILNYNEISFECMVNVLEEFGYKFNILNMSDFIEKINSLNDEYVKEYILSTNLNLFSQKKSLKLLKHHGFKWSKYNKEYIYALIKATKNLS